MINQKAHRFQFYIHADAVVCVIDMPLAAVCSTFAVHLRCEVEVWLKA